MRSSVRVFGEPDAGELPPRLRIEEIAIAYPRMTIGRRQRASAQYHLIDHEFAVVLAERPGLRPIARIGRIGGARPLPYEPKGVSDLAAAGGYLPFRLARQIFSDPTRECIGLVVAHVAQRRRRIDRAQSAERHRQPRPVNLSPVA